MVAKSGHGYLDEGEGRGATLYAGRLSAWHMIGGPMVYEYWVRNNDICSWGLKKSKMAIGGGGEDGQYMKMFGAKRMREECLRPLLLDIRQVNQ